MTKTLQEIEQENRRLILEAVHGCSYKEALEKELGVGCILEKAVNAGSYIGWCEILKYEQDDFLPSLISYGHTLHEWVEPSDWQWGKFTYQIIGKPLTLSRVLLALSKKASPYHMLFLHAIEATYYPNPNGAKIGIFDAFDEDKEVAWWELYKETLEEQSEETQRQINQFLNNEQH